MAKLYEEVAMLLDEVVSSRTDVDLKALSRTNAMTYEVQQRSLDLTLLDPPVDGDFGPLSKLALRQFAAAVGLRVDLTIEWQLAKALLEYDVETLVPVTPKADLADRIFRHMRQKNYFFPRFANYLTVAYVEA